MDIKEQYTGSILVIGDEILSGRTQDTNSNHIAKKMTEIGINISDIRVIPDNKEIIIESKNEVKTELQSLTIPQLRQKLLENGETVPRNLKKRELINLLST